MIEFKDDLLSSEEEKFLVNKWKTTKDQIAAKKIIDSFNPLIKSFLKKYRNYRGVILEDLKQEVHLAMIVALDKYEIDRGNRFSSYAKFWINSYCQNYVMKNFSIVKIGNTSLYKKLFFQLRYIKKKFANEENNNLDILNTISKNLNTSVQILKEIDERINSADCSLNEKVNDISETTYLEILCCKESSVEDKLIENESNNNFDSEILEIKKTFSEKEWQVLYNRKLAEQTLSLNEISIMLDLTKEKVRTIEQNTTRKMAKLLMAKKLRRKYSSF